VKLKKGTTASSYLFFMCYMCVIP